MGEKSASVPAPMNWQDQDDHLREMWLRNQPPAVIAEQLGRSVAAIMTRAARLGLPRRAAPGRKPGYRRTEGIRGSTGVAVRTRSETNIVGVKGEGEVQILPRICLMCLNKFPSQGRHNRICPACKGSAEYSAGSSIPDFDFKVET